MHFHSHARRNAYELPMHLFNVANFGLDSLLVNYRINNVQLYL